MIKPNRALFLSAALLLTFAAAADAAAQGPRLSVSEGTVRDAMTCNGKLAGAGIDPVLLIHGTFADSDINWRWNYQKVLPEMPVLMDYNARLTAREAFHRAADATWPATLFPEGAV